MAGLHSMSIFSFVKPAQTIFYSCYAVFHSESLRLGVPIVSNLCLKYYKFYV